MDVYGLLFWTFDFQTHFQSSLYVSENRSLPQPPRVGASQPRTALSGADGNRSVTSAAGGAILSGSAWLSAAAPQNHLGRLE